MLYHFLIGFYFFFYLRFFLLKCLSKNTTYSYPIKDFFIDFFFRTGNTMVSFFSSVFSSFLSVVSSGVVTELFLSSSFFSLFLSGLLLLVIFELSFSLVVSFLLLSFLSLSSLVGVVGFGLGLEVPSSGLLGDGFGFGLIVSSLIK